jgi:ubiquinol-cytochrome c reductase cytochrome c1 subunit
MRRPVLTRAVRTLGVLALGAVALGAALAVATPARAAEEVELRGPPGGWSFSGIFGTFNRASAQRGFQVYREVCSTCHGLRQVAYRNLTALGYSMEEARAVAASAEFASLNDAGEPATRPGTPADRFASPYPNPLVARARNNGALPPDLSLMVKAREHGPNYIYSLMTGYSDPPAGVTLMEGMNYNTAFPGHQIAMPPPLSENRVTYSDGTNATVAQMAQDVTTFLAWAAEPELEARHKLGVQVIIFLLVLTGILYAVKRKVWADLH